MEITTDTLDLEIRLNGLNELIEDYEIRLYKLKKERDDIVVEILRRK